MYFQIYCLYQTYQIPGPVSTGYDEQVHPKFKTLIGLYSAPSPLDPTIVSPIGSFAHIISFVESYREPTTYQKATMSPQGQPWKATMDKEYNSLMDHHT